MLMLFFFFSSRRRHTRYWRDWSSDVCSSDLVLPRKHSGCVSRGELAYLNGTANHLRRNAAVNANSDRRFWCKAQSAYRDRKSVVEGKRGDFGGGRVIKKKKKKKRV